MRRAIVAIAFLIFTGAAYASPLTPSFFARHDYPGLGASWVAVADTNGDGIPDLIADSEGFVYVLFGNGDGTFRSGTQTRSILEHRSPSLQAT
jgi:hypothetical protein